MRSPHASGRTAPASAPLVAPRDTPSATVDADPPEAVDPVSRDRLPRSRRDTSTIRPRAARQAARIASGAMWTPSAISCTTTSSRASAAPATPGSRVGERAHRVEQMRHRASRRDRTRRAPSSPSRRCGRARRRPRVATSASISSTAPASSGARVTIVTGQPQRGSDASRSSSASRRHSAAWAPARAGDRNGPSRWAPRIRAGPPARRLPDRRSARASVERAVTSVGWYQSHTVARERTTHLDELAPAPRRARRRRHSRSPAGRRARGSPARCPSPGRPTSVTNAVLDLDVAAHERAVHDRRCDTEPQTHSVVYAR